MSLLTPKYSIRNMGSNPDYAKVQKSYVWLMFRTVVVGVFCFVVVDTLIVIFKPSLWALAYVGVVPGFGFPMYGIYRLFSARAYLEAYQRRDDDSSTLSTGQPLMSKYYPGRQPYISWRFRYWLNIVSVVGAIGLLIGAYWYEHHLIK